MILRPPSIQTFHVSPISLHRVSGTINCKNIVFRNIDDARLYPSPKILAKNIIYANCDKNFIYFTMFPHIFPHASNIFLNSHPCEAQVLSRFPSKVNIYLPQRLSTYKRRWAPENPRVVVIPDEEMARLVDNY